MLFFGIFPDKSGKSVKKVIFRKNYLMPNLFAQEIDADQRIKAYQAEIRKKIFDMKVEYAVKQIQSLVGPK